MYCVGGSERCKVGVGGDSGGGTITASVAHDVPGLAFEVNKLLFDGEQTVSEGLQAGGAFLPRLHWLR